MKIQHALAVVGAAGVLFVATPPHPVHAAPQASTVQHVDDDAIESSVETRLKKDAVLAPRDIDVESDHGRVTLTGDVRTAVEKARAGRLAKVAGVVSVTNHIEVNPNIDESKTDNAAAKTKAGLNKAVDATAEAARKAKAGVQKGAQKSAQGVGKAAGKTSQGLDAASDKLSDTAIAARVKSGLSGEPLLKDTAVDVEVKDKVVTLRGTVGSEASKARAAAIATETKGVVRVVNDLVVRDQ
ncbi:MAG TPA: BON domain-containing protein [Vicinamibacterales bacterium]|nr:BON domain-containing protein [Vicinamibacterales bacterium]